MKTSFDIRNDGCALALSNHLSRHVHVKEISLWEAVKSFRRERAEDALRLDGAFLPDDEKILNALSAAGPLGTADVHVRVRGRMDQGYSYYEFEGNLYFMRTHGLIRSDKKDNRLFWRITSKGEAFLDYMKKKAVKFSRSPFQRYEG